MKSHLKAALAVLVVCLVAYTTALSFDAPPNTIKCFREILTRGQVINGEVGVTPSPFSQLKFWVENAYKRLVYSQEDVTSQIKFSFAADLDGEYKMCFSDGTRVGAFGGGAPRRVSFSYQSDDTRTKEFKAPTKTGLKPLEAELLRIEQVVLHVVAESDHQREREATHRNTSESLNSRVAWYSMLSLFCLVALSAAQVFYIQRYLKKTKWID